MIARQVPVGIEGFFSEKKRTHMFLSNYWVLIPPQIYNNENLSDKAKFLYGRILALANKEGYCYASNSFFAKELKVTKRSISTYISILEKLGCIKRKTIYGDNEKTVKQRQLTPLLKPVSMGIEKNFNTPIEKNFHDSIRDKRIRIEREPPQKNSITKHQKYLKDLPFEDIQEFSKKFGFSEKQVKYEAEKCLDWLLSKGRQPKNYKAQFRNWLRKAGEFKEQNMNKEKTLTEIIKEKVKRGPM